MTSLPSPSVDPLLDQEISNYRIVRRLGHGGMGAVYEAIHPVLHRKAAIKILHEHTNEDPESVERFFREARILAKLAHENIVETYDFGKTPDGKRYLILEFMEGETLYQRLQRGALSFPEALPIIEQTARALDFAHRNGILHRDIKPENIFLVPRVQGPPKVKILDFGLARRLVLDRSSQQLTQMGLVVGTPQYMAPEQISGSELSARTDLYSLAVSIFEMLQGQPPFLGNTLEEVFRGHLFDDRPTLTAPTSQQIPAELSPILVRAMAKKPDQRYDSVALFLEEILALQKSRKYVPTPSTKAQQLSLSKNLLQRVLAIAMPTSAAVFALGLTSVGLRVGERLSTSIVLASPMVASSSAVDNTVADSQEKARSILTETSKAKDPALRIRVAQGIGTFLLQEYSALLRTLLDDDETAVKEAALLAYGELAMPDSLLLLQTAREKLSPKLKIRCDQALSRLGQTSARTNLQKTLNSDNRELQKTAAIFLAQSNDAKAVTVLQLLRRDEKQPLSKEWLGALAANKDSKALAQIEKLAASKSVESKLAAAELFASIGDPRGREIAEAVLADSKSPLRLVAAEILLTLEERKGESVFLEALTSSKAAVREKAILSLAKLKSYPPSLGDILTKDPDASVRLAAAIAILSQAR